jgi:hypothetical protein
MFEEKEPQKSVELPNIDLTALTPEARKDVYELAGKEIASSIGSRALCQMLAASKISVWDLSAISGFDVSLLSDLVLGKLPAGPELWLLVALGEALDLDVDVSFSIR